MARIIFPSNPTNNSKYTDKGKTYQYNSAKNRWKVIGAEAVSATRAAEIDTLNSTVESLQTQIDESGSGTEAYANSSLLPLTGLEAGQMAFDQANNRLYITNGSGWYKIALINQTPAITASIESAELGADGNTVIFTYSITEPEGTPVTVTVSNSGISNTSLGNVVHYSSNNTIEVNNFAGEGSEWSGNVTLTVSDGVNLGTDSVSLSVVYSDPPEVGSAFAVNGPGTYVDLDSNTIQNITYRGTASSGTLTYSAGTGYNSNGRHAVYGYSHQSFTVSKIWHGTRLAGSNSFFARFWWADAGDNPYGGGTPTNPSGLINAGTVSYSNASYSSWDITDVSIPAGKYFYFEWEDGPYYNNYITPSDNFTFRQNGNPVVTLLKNGWTSTHEQAGYIYPGGGVQTYIEGGTDTETVWSFGTQIPDVGFQITNIGV